MYGGRGGGDRWDEGAGGQGGGVGWSALETNQANSSSLLVIRTSSSIHSVEHSFMNCVSAWQSMVDRASPRWDHQRDQHHPWCTLSVIRLTGSPLRPI